MAMVNPAISPIFNPAMKDSRWLTLEVCREYIRNKCTRSDQECKFAHPPPHVEVQNGRVTCCFDSIKGKCQRKDPPCKYLHPPQHLKEQLLQNGRNNLIMRNIQMQAMATGFQPMVPGVFPTVMLEPTNNKTIPYPTTAQHMLPGQYSVVHPCLVQNNGAPSYNPYMSPSLGVPNMVPAGVEAGCPTIPVSAATTAQIQGYMQPNAAMQQKLSRADRLEPSTSNGSEPTYSWTGSQLTDGSLPPTSQYSHLYFQPQVVEVLTGAGKKRPRDPADDLVLSMNPGMQGMVPMMKRPAMADNKSGMPMYQPTGAAAYQHAALAAMQLQQQPFVPVTIAGHTPGVQRF